MTTTRTFTLTCAAALLMGVPTPSASQTIRGQVADSITAAPVGAGFVVLLAANGAEITRTLTTRDGRFTFTPADDQQGPFRFRSERIGYRLAVTEAFDAPLGGSVEVTIWVSALPTPLSAIEVRESTECKVRPDEDERTAVVWEEARKALAAASWTASRQLYHVVSNVYDRDLDGRRRRVLQEQHRASVGLSATPFVSRDPAALEHNGYIELDGDALVYYAPDAHVLQDDGFLGTHCFRLRRPDEGNDLIGLAFEPVPSRDLPDVEGVLWLDRASSELRSLEYRYANLPRERPLGISGGGTVEFMPLPSGAWIVHRWRIETPLAFRTERVSPFDRWDRQVADAYRHTGGEVLTITDSTGSRVYQAELAEIIGVVVDSTRGDLAPLAGAKVQIVGTWFSGTTNRQGVYRLAAPLDGDFSVTFAHPRADSLGHTPPPRAVTLARGQTDTLWLAVPPIEDILASHCPDLVQGAHARVLLGAVRDSVTGEASPGATVVAAWQHISPSLDFQNLEVDATTDSSGAFVLCELEHERPTIVYAVGPGGRSKLLRVAFEGTGVEVGDAYHETYETTAGMWRTELTLRPLGTQATVLAGIVTDAVTGAAIPHAVVAIDGSPHETVTNSSGMFRVEGTPPGTRRIEVRRPGYRTRSGEVDVDEDAPTVLGAELLALTPAAQVTGSVTGPESHEPVSDVWVTLVSLEGDSVMMTFSDSLGEFVLTAPQPGSYYVSARRLGYSPDLAGPYELQPGHAVDVAFSMRRLAFVLDPLNVTAAAVDQFLESVGFNHRKRFGRGYFMDREEIEKRLGSVADAAQLLSVVPGVEVVEGLSDRVGGSLIRISRAACDDKGPRIWVDGFLIDTQDMGEMELYALSQVVQPEDVYAIEVYRSPSQVPVEYGGAQSGCGVVLIWTIRGR